MTTSTAPARADRRARGGPSWVWRCGWLLAAAIPLAFLAIFFAWPVATLVGRGFASEDGSTLGAVAEVLTSARTWRILRTSTGWPR